jgi:hypothetical protein
MENTQEQKLSEENVQNKTNTEDVELNEEQLEAVAGGKAVLSPIMGGGPLIYDPKPPICTTSPVFPDDL